MPIDRELLRNKYESQVDDNLKNRLSGIGKGLNEVQGTVESSRDPFVSELLGTQNHFTGSPAKLAPFKSAVYSDLTNSLKGNLANEALKQKGTAIDLVYNNTLRRVLEATGDREQAEAYARQNAAQEAARRFAAEESKRNRNSALRKQEIASEFQNEGLDLVDSYANESSSNAYQQALMRSLFGLGGTAATAYYLNRNPMSLESPTRAKYSASASSTDMPFGPELMRGYYPQRPTGGFR